MWFHESHRTFLWYFCFLYIHTENVKFAFYVKSVLNFFWQEEDELVVASCVLRPFGEEAYESPDEDEEWNETVLENSSFKTELRLCSESETFSTRYLVPRAFVTLDQRSRNERNLIQSSAGQVEEGLWLRNWEVSRWLRCFCAMLVNRIAIHSTRQTIKWSDWRGLDLLASFIHSKQPKLI